MTGGFPDGGDIEAAVRSVGFEPLPVKQGDVVLIHGAVDHLSLPNTSIASRHTFQLHLVRSIMVTPPAGPFDCHAPSVRTSPSVAGSACPSVFQRNFSNENNWMTDIARRALLILIH